MEHCHWDSRRIPCIGGCGQILEDVCKENTAFYRLLIVAAKLASNGVEKFPQTESSVMIVYIVANRLEQSEPVQRFVHKILK